MMVVGGYMYLRSLVGPEEIFFMLYDEPDLIHEMMEKWFEIADAASAYYQEHVTIDMLAFGEDISYNNGLLISPDMIRTFLFPYYKRLYDNIKKRNIDQDRHVYFYVDTDGNLDDVIPLYKEIGVDVIAPMEVASGCDPVELRKQHPDIVLMGGIDKRVIAKTKEDIDAFLEHVIPFMKEQGGYIPMFDHGVPDEVTLENYRYYRKKMLEYSKL
jgi:uroporphyrinogen decarboxylase